MVFTAVLLATTALVLFALALVAYGVHRRQHRLTQQKDAAVLLRRVDHLFKVARQNAVARALLEEALRVVKRSLDLDPTAPAATTARRECEELLAGLDKDPVSVAASASSTAAEFPEAELIEAQLHLTEAARVLHGLEKRGQLGYEQLSEMITGLKQAQRGLDLRLQLRRASDSLTTTDRISGAMDVDRDKSKSFFQ
jgi:hypothetical protein